MPWLRKYSMTATKTPKTKEGYAKRVSMLRKILWDDYKHWIDLKANVRNKEERKLYEAVVLTYEDAILHLEDLFGMRPCPPR